MRTITRNLETSVTRGKCINESEKCLLVDVPTERLPPGISNIKLVQMHANYRTFVLPAFKEIMCPKPPNEVFGRAKNDRKEKDKKRKKSKGKVKSEKSTVITVSKKNHRAPKDEF